MNQTRLKFFGRSVQPAKTAYRVSVKDDFKESEHPRAANGQFGSGGATGKQQQGGVTAPKKGSASHSIWSMAAELEAQGSSFLTAGNLKKLAESKGVSLNPSTISVQLGHFKKYQAAAKASAPPTAPAQPAPEPAKPALENNLKTFGELSESIGLKKEGVYGGYTYYKALNGTKASYNEETNSWALKSPAVLAGEWIKGNGLENLQSAMQALPKGAAAPTTQGTAGKPAAAQPSAPVAPAKPVSPYGRAKAIGNFNYSSKGAVTEKGFTPGIRKSIQAYKGSSYQSINKAMRFDADFDNVSHQTLIHILNLQQAFKAAPPTTKDIKVGRKVDASALQAMCQHAGLPSPDELQAGNVIRDEGVVSTSHSAHVWSGDVKFNITVPKGSKAIDLSETINKGEEELMLPPGSGLKIVSVKKPAKSEYSAFQYEIECEHVP